MTKYCLLHFAVKCVQFSESFGCNKRYVSSQPVQSEECRVSDQYLQFLKNNNNNFIYTSKIDQLNLNIKTAGINLCAVVKPFQISVAIKNY